jgi:hypothetical protein
MRPGPQRRAECAVGTGVTGLPGVKSELCAEKMPGSALFTHKSVPNVWSGRAMQEDFVELAVSGLGSMYLASGIRYGTPLVHQTTDSNFA